MCSPLRFKKTRRKLLANSRGFSSIVGAVFAVLVMISVISTVFVWSLSQNTRYNNTVTQTRQADSDRSNEKVVADFDINRISDATVSLNGTFVNYGPLSARIITLWVADANNTSYNHKALSVTLPSGNMTTFGGSTAIYANIPNQVDDRLSCWFITERGNIISQKGAVTTINNYPTTVVGAMVSQGIGSVAMNFSLFWHYDIPKAQCSGSPGSERPADGTALPLSRASLNYTISLSNYTIFHVVLTDYDPLGQNITLNTNSSIYMLGSQSRTVKWGVYNLVNVTNGKIYPSSTNYKVNLILGVETELYFAGTIYQIDAGLTYPLNILLYGTKGGDEYGQNIPFVSVYLVN